MPEQPPRRDRRVRPVAVALTGAAGLVDCLGFLALYHVYVANMSGNSVALAVRSITGEWHRVAHRGLAVATFVIGLFLSGLVIEAARRYGVRRLVALALVLEAVCLGLLTVLGRLAVGPGGARVPDEGMAQVLLVLAAMSMGVQNATLRETGALTIYTTHVTGTLTQLAREAVEYAFWRYDRRLLVAREREGREPDSAAAPSGWQVLFLASLEIAYIVGAAVAAMLWKSRGIEGFAVALAVVVAVIAVDLHRPLARPAGGSGR